MTRNFSPTKTKLTPSAISTTNFENEPHKSGTPSHFTEACPRRYTTCNICSEPLDRGLCSYPWLTLGDPSHCYHDEAIGLYWNHIRTSERHQAILRAEGKTMYRMLHELPTVLPAARAYQKKLTDPNYQALQRIFR